jgi:hypothetical protein
VEACEDPKGGGQSQGAESGLFVHLL